MLPLRSQICYLSRDSIEQNTSAKLQLNRITLCQNTVPVPNDGRPYIDRKLLGGILSLSDIMMKETTPLAQSIHLSTDVASILQSDFSDIIPSFDSNNVSNKSVKDDNLRCSFDNSFYSKFRTNRAQIPLWSDVEDLSETFSTTLRFKTESQPVFTRQPCSLRNSIIGKSRKVGDFLKNETSAVEVVATIQEDSATFRQIERWGITGIDPCRNIEENDADDSQHRNKLISSEFIVIPLEELRELFEENTASYKTSDLLDTGYHGSLIRAPQLTSKLLEMHFNEDGRNDVFPIQTIKNLTLTTADFVVQSNSPSKLIDLYRSCIDGAILHEDAKDFHRFIDPWAALLRNIESFKGCRTIFQDLDILNPNSFELSHSGKMEGLTWISRSSTSGLLFYCPLLFKENTPKEHWIHEEKTKEVSYKACQLQDQLLETSKFHGKLTFLKKDKVWNRGDAGFLKDRLLSSTHAFRCIPIVPNSKSINGDLPNIRCHLEGQEYTQNWTWQPVQTRKQSVVEIMQISRSLLVRQNQHQQGISASYNDAGCQSQHRPRMQLKKKSILHKSTKYTFRSMLNGYHDLGLDHHTADATHTILEKNPESNIIKFIYFAFLPVIVQHISPKIGVKKMTTMQNKTNESNSVTAKISELSAGVQASESLPTEFETQDRKRSYMIDSSKNEDEGGQKTKEIHYAQEQKEIPLQYLSHQYESTPPRILDSSNAPIVLSTVKAATASDAKCPDNMTDLITQSLDLDQMVSSYLVMHGNPQALATKAVLTPTSFDPSKTIIRPDTVSNAFDRSRFIHDRTGEAISVQTKVSVITPGNEAVKAIENNEFLENEHRSTVDSAKFDGLRILISETFMERSESSPTITALAERYGILCIDTLLEDPITFILDSTTAVCIVEEDVIGQRNLLKEFVKQLTLLVYKFTCIWIIVTGHYHDSMEDKDQKSYADEGVAMMQLFAAISRFPVDVIVRSIASSDAPDSQSNRDTMMGKHLAKLVYHICNDTANAVCAYENILRERYLSRNFLNSLLCMDFFAFTEHCDFLQQFPTLNFYSAAQILDAITLQDIAYHLPEKIDALKEILRFVPSISDFCLDSFFALYSLHCGLEKSLNTTAIALLDDGKDLRSPLTSDPTHGRSSISFENRAAPVLYTNSIGDDVGQYYASNDVPQDATLIEDDDYQYYAEHDDPQYDYITRGVEREDDFTRYDGPAVYSDPSILDSGSAQLSNRSYRSRGCAAEFDRFGDDYNTQERGGKDRGNYGRQMNDFSADYS